MGLKCTQLTPSLMIDLSLEMDRAYYLSSSTWWLYSECSGGHLICLMLLADLRGRYTQLGGQLNGWLFVLDSSVDLRLGICVCTCEDSSRHFLLAIQSDATAVMSIDGGYMLVVIL